MSDHMIKLSIAQRALMISADENGYLDCVTNYPPAKKLLEFNLAVIVPFRFSDRMRLTDAGKDMLERLKMDARYNV